MKFIRVKVVGTHVEYESAGLIRELLSRSNCSNFTLIIISSELMSAITTALSYF